MKPLTKTMKEVLALVRDGWIPRVSVTFDGSTWLSKGGDTKRVLYVTLSALRERGMLLYHPDFPIAHYTLSEEGREIAKKL